MRVYSRFILLSSAAVLAACSHPTSPAIGRIAGTYRAVTLSTTEGGVTTDWLAEGGEARLALLADGRTSGRFFLPNINEDGEREQGVNFEADLAGTWSVRGEIVTLDHAADTFLRDMEYQVGEGRLAAEGVFAGVTVRVVLRRLP
jgi:hypothetical protein